MVRRYAEPVDVRPERRTDGRQAPTLPVARPALRGAGRARALAGAPGLVGRRGGPGAPRGRATGATVRGARVRAGRTGQEVRGPRVDSPAEREVWRVEASRGRVYGSGVYDLCRDAAHADPWRRSCGSRTEPVAPWPVPAGP